ncbi:MAG TPA: hypothetical protein VK823_28050 [Streptosporangiaceae bacterium]|nr:hypothetical protein [Streptosporangiaceae bacterium]
MSEIERSFSRAPVPPADQELAYRGEGEVSHRRHDDRSGAGGPQVTGWITKHWVILAAFAMIIVQLIWKAAFLGHFYFRQDDIHFTELAVKSPLGWNYLSYVGSGHLHPGVLLIMWILARHVIYSWGAAVAIELIMIAIASFAAWRLLRTLIGSRPAMLIPLALFLFSPLTLPNDSWFQSGIESLPLQAAIFLSLTSHLYYVRTRRFGHAVAAAAWIVVGLVFFEKAAVLPVILFAVTAGFLVDGPLLTSAKEALVRYWRGWALYVGLVAVYGVVLLTSLEKSTVAPGAASASSTTLFVGDQLKDSLLPGMFGGPWHWAMFSGGATAYSTPSSTLAWISILAAIAVVGLSIMTRPRAVWAWAILAVWVVLADFGPVLIGRASDLASFAGFIGLDSRYVADAPAMAAVCVALAFWPVVQPAEAGPSRRRRRPAEYFTSPGWLVAGIGLTAVLVIGSFVSANNYENLQIIKLYNIYGPLYLKDAKAALAGNLPAGTTIVDRPMPDYIMNGEVYQQDALQSAALGPLVSARTVHWVEHPTGTLDELGMLDRYGHLMAATVGPYDSTRQPGQVCYPVRKGRIAISLSSVPYSSYVQMMRIGYLAAPSVAGQVVTVNYGSYSKQISLQPKENAVYIPVLGSATQITVTGAPATGLCIGDAEVGSLEPTTTPLG